MLNGLNLLKPFRMLSSISKVNKTLWLMHFRASMFFFLSTLDARFLGFEHIK
jgi:hypothetical protein